MRTPSREAVAMIGALGAKFGMQVADKAGAHQALDEGADFLIRQGMEAGGHVRGHRGLYEAVRGEVKDLPFARRPGEAPWSEAEAAHRFAR